MKKNHKRGLIIVGIVIGAILVSGIGYAQYFLMENLILKVTSGAMEPALRMNDGVIIDETIPFDSLEIGDIIAFYKPTDHNKMIVMRIVAVIDDDPLTFRTKGDANPASIPGTDFPITEEEYIGRLAEIIRAP